MRETVYSAAATGIFDSRSSSRSASFLTASGMPAASILVAQLLDLLGLLVALAELLLDRLQLLAQEVLALVLADLGLHLRLDLRAELEHLELLDQHPVERVHPRPDVERLEDLLLHRGADGGQAGGDEVGELARVGDVGRERLQVVGQQRRQRDDLLEVALDVALQRVDLEVILVAQLLVGDGDRRLQVRTGLRDAIEADAGQALDDQPQAAVGQLEHLVDVRGRADRVEVLLDGSSTEASRCVKTPIIRPRWWPRRSGGPTPRAPRRAA